MESDIPRYILEHSLEEDLELAILERNLKKVRRLLNEVRPKSLHISRLVSSPYEIVREVLNHDPERAPSLLFCLACERRNTQLAKWILKNYTFNSAQIQEMLPAALSSGDLKLIKTLESMGASLDTNSRFMISKASESGSLELLHYLVEEKGLDLEKVSLPVLSNFTRNHLKEWIMNYCNEIFQSKGHSKIRDL